MEMGVMDYIGEIIAFVMGLTIMYAINYWIGYAQERGRKRASGEYGEEKTQREYQMILSHLVNSDIISTAEINEQVFSNKKTNEELYQILQDLKAMGRVKSTAYMGMEDMVRDTEWYYSR